MSGEHARDHQLDLWQRAMAYAVQISAFTAQSPEAERYNQISRMAHSLMQHLGT